MNDDDIEVRLRGHLRRKARVVSGEPDFDDLSDRVRARHRRRQRALGAGVAVALLAGPAAGYAVGRTVQSPASEVRTTVAASARTSTAGATPAPTIQTGGFTLAEGGDAAVGDAAGTPVPVLPAEIVKGSDFSWTDQTLGRRFLRTTAADIALRVYDARFEPPDFGNPFWTPPAWCYASGYVQADISTDLVAGVASAPTYDELPEGEMNVVPTLVGTAEGAPVWVLVVQPPPGAVTVQAAFPGGATDGMDVVDGIAVLAAAVSNDDLDGKATVQVFDRAGSLLHAQQVTTLPYQTNGKLGTGDGPECVPPPPELPAAGEQPADPDGARAAVTAAYEAAYAGSNSDEARAAAIADPTGFDTVFEQLRTGSFADTVLAATAAVREIVFTAPDHAWLRYDIMVNGSQYFTDRFGEAVLIDGAWKVANDTICRDVRLAAIECPG
jgi:hypothetical protein